MRVLWTDLALDRVESIALHVAADDPDAARRWASGLFAAVEQLARFPEMGRLSPQLQGRGVRELVFGAYRVFYRVGDEIAVLSVRHASQLVRGYDGLEDDG